MASVIVRQETMILSAKGSIAAPSIDACPFTLRAIHPSNLEREKAKAKERQTGRQTERREREEREMEERERGKERG